MRSGTGLLLLVALASAQQPAGDPFAPPAEESFPRDAWPGAVERVTEALARARRELAGDPGDVAGWERVRALLGRLNRANLLVTPLRNARQAPGLEEADRVRLGALLGDILVSDLRPGADSNILRQIAQSFLTGEARQVLEAAVAADAGDARSREGLARLLELADATGEAGRIERLRNEAAVLRMREMEKAPPVAPPLELADDVAALRAQAEAIEQVEADPDHARALDLRRRALVFAYCDRTIPFEYAPACFGPVSLLAPEGTVRENLTRTFLSARGEIETVDVIYHPPTAVHRAGAVDALAKATDSNAAAALVAVLRNAGRDDPLAEQALEALAGGTHTGLREALPRLLQTALHPATARGYGDDLRRRAIRLAGLLRCEAAAPMLAWMLGRDDDLLQPLGVADALGRIGRAEDLATLEALARDTAREIHFRREAVFALGHHGAERAEALADDRALEIAVAAARFRATGDDAARGRILAGLGHDLEVDDASGYCVELRIAMAVPLLESFLEERPDHYAAGAVRRALAALRKG